MAIRQNTSIKLYFLLAIMSVVVLTAGTYGISKLKMLNQITGTMHADRLVTIQQLSSVRSFYESKLLSIPYGVSNHQQTFEQAEMQLDSFEEKSDFIWKAYQRTSLTPKEARLIRESNVLMRKAEPALAKLKRILKTKDALALDNFIMNDYYESVEPIGSKINKLIELQVSVSQDKFRISGEIYHNTQRNAYLFLIFWFSFCLLLGIYVIKNIQFFIKKLRLSNDKIAQSEEKFRLSFMTSHDAFYIGTLDDGKIVDVNEGFCNIYGYTREEVIGKTSLELNMYSNQEDRAKLFERLKADGKVKDLELRVRKKTGEVIIVSVSANTSEMNNEKIILSVIRDITEQKRSEEATELFRYQFENSPDIILVINKDLIIESINRSRPNGPTVEELIGMNSIEVLPEESRNIARKAILKCFQTGQNQEIENALRDNKWVRSRFVPIITGGEITHIMIIASDITERKKAELNLIQSEEKNRALIENISDTIILVNEKLEVIYQSPSFARTAGFTLKELKGKTILDVIHPDEIPSSREIIEIAHASPGAAIPFQLRILHNTGHFIWIEGTVTNLLQNDSVQAYVFNYRDISSRIAMESERLKITEEMLQRNRDLEQFAYIVSHNLRAPVANIIGLTNFLKDEDIEQDEKDEMAEGLRVSVHALDTVIKDLNTILQTKRDISEKKETVKFSGILKGIKLSMATLIKNEQVVFDSDFSEIDEMVTLKSYLHSIFYNLISNSIKYKKPEIAPVIEIRSKLSGNKIELIFKDNGLGIDLEKRSGQVFGLYKRFHSHVEGKGMGLYMVKTQVETLGGKISVKSEINKGTEFKIEFKIE